MASNWNPSNSGAFGFPMHAVVLEYPPMTWDLPVSFEFLGTSCERFRVCFGLHLRNSVHTTLRLPRRYRASSRHEESCAATQYCHTLHWSELCLDYFSSSEFHGPADLPPWNTGCPEFSKFSTIVTHEDPTCHQIRLHILDTTCFLLRVRRMPSVHR